MLLNKKNHIHEKLEADVDLSDLKPCPPWWINPPLYLLFFLLPFFLLTIIISEPYMLQLGQKVNNITPENISIGLLSIAMLVLGSVAFSFLKNERNEKIEYDTASVERVLLFLGTLSFAANIILFFPLVFHPGLLVSFFTGDPSAMFQIRETMAKIPGVTSFVTACMPFFSLYSFATIPGAGHSISKPNKKLFYILIFFTVVRAIMGSERLAIVIAVMAFMVPRIVFSWKPSTIRALIPFAGILGVFGLFALGEYFRSWQHYSQFYESYLEFISVRFMGYFSTAINTGSGVITYYDPVGYPYYTASWFNQLLNIFGVQIEDKPSSLVEYLHRYATPEFNNPGGLYLPYFDYGIIGGCFFFLLIGIFTGWLFYKFLSKDPIGILLFPCWFVGCLDLIRIIIWVWSGFTPIIVLSFLSVFFLRKKRASPPIPLKVLKSASDPPAP